MVRRGCVEFIPPPAIDLSGRPRPGGLTAITIDGDGDGDGDSDSDSDAGDSDADDNAADPPHGYTRENSARATPN